MPFRLFAAFALVVLTVLITAVRGRADITALPVEFSIRFQIP